MPATYTVARDLVDGDLGIADEGAGIAQLSRVSRCCRCQWRSATKEAPLATAKSFQETYIRPKKGDCWVVVGPARLAIVRAAGVNASANGPGDPTVSGLPGADALSAAARSQKNCKESAGRFVVESNRVAKVRPVSTCEGAWVEAGPGGAAVAGERCAGVVGGGGSGIVVGDDDLVGVIRVGQSCMFPTA